MVSMASLSVEVKDGPGDAFLLASVPARPVRVLLGDLDLADLGRGDLRHEPGQQVRVGGEDGTSALLVLLRLGQAPLVRQAVRRVEVLDDLEELVLVTVPDLLHGLAVERVLLLLRRLAVERVGDLRHAAPASSVWLTVG